MNTGAWPAALEKAEDLYGYAMRSGYPLATFEVLVTLEEGRELLEWLPGAGLTLPEYLPVLRQDIAEAKKRDDPWIVLEHFTLKGMKMRRAEAVH